MLETLSKLAWIPGLAFIPVWTNSVTTTHGFSRSGSIDVVVFLPKKIMEITLRFEKAHIAFVHSVVLVLEFLSFKATWNSMKELGEKVGRFCENYLLRAVLLVLCEFGQSISFGKKCRQKDRINIKLAG